MIVTMTNMIRGRLGKFVKVDMGQDEKCQGKFLRVRVKLDIRNPIRWGMKITWESGDTLWIDFKYERLPKFCFRCGKLGHVQKECKETVDHESDQYGAWLRTTPLMWKSKAIHNSSPTHL